MTKHLDKQLRRLAARRADYDSISAEKRRGTKRPGSMNSDKTRSVKGRRRK
jgi:hypothetical protein